jgi:uncharacterized protein YjbI with pentapeptide repeats
MSVVEWKGRTIRTVDQAALNATLAAHAAWLAGEEGGIRAGLHGANLSEADLHRANLDFACLPFKCGGLYWRIDSRIARQLFYHLCSMECDDPEFIALRNSGLDFANKFHRVGECGRLVPKQEE